MRSNGSSHGRLRSRMPLVACAMIVAVVSSACESGGIGALDVLVDAAVEECHDTDRELYESAMAHLGRAPETPEYPETARYTVCYNRWDGEVRDAWMVDGEGATEGEAVAEETTEEQPTEEASATEGTIENEPTEEATEDASAVDETPSPEAPEESRGGIPAGTYVGEFRWSDSPGKELLENEIVVEISDDGLVSGQAAFVWTHTTPRESFDCDAFHEYADYYSVSGEIAGSFREPVRISVSTYESHDSTDCGELGERTESEEACECEGWISVNGGALTINCNPGDCRAFLRGDKQ